MRIEISEISNHTKNYSKELIVAKWEKLLRELS